MNVEKERQAIERLRAFEPKTEPYYLAYSGGKDSDCIRILADLAGVNHEIHHKLTTVDAPETVRYVKSIPNVIIDKPERSMWQLIVYEGMPPTRLMRYCCKELKEKGGKGRIVVTGVRWAESVNRKANQGLVNIHGKPKAVTKAADELGASLEKPPKGGLILNDDNDVNRRLVEHCYRTTKTLVNPIIDWTEQDVWDFLRYYGCESNPLYKEGQCRVGCIGCPMQGGKRMKQQFAKYPIYKQNYILAFDKMVQHRFEKGQKPIWKNGKEVYSWWVGDNPLQISMFEEEK